VRKSVDLEPELIQQIEEVQALTREKASTIIRLALRCGLPIVANRFQAPRPDGYFDEVYAKHKERDPDKMEPAKPLKRK